MSYARVEFTPEELDLIEWRIAAGETFAQEAITTAGSPEERDFYQSAVAHLSGLKSITSSRQPGGQEFTEDQLNLLKGTVNGRTPSEMAMRCLNAKKTADPMLPLYEKEYEVWSILMEKLNRPFAEDRSQDPDDDVD